MKKYKKLIIFILLSLLFIIWFYPWYRQKREYYEILATHDIYKAVDYIKNNKLIPGWQLYSLSSMFSKSSVVSYNLFSECADSTDDKYGNCARIGLPFFDNFVFVGQLHNNSANSSKYKDKYVILSQASVKSYFVKYYFENQIRNWKEIEIAEQDFLHKDDFDIVSTDELVEKKELRLNQLPIKISIDKKNILVNIYSEGKLKTATAYLINGQDVEYKEVKNYN